ncbi:hypothetical protein D3C76_804580 [compost metagenome]
MITLPIVKPGTDKQAIILHSRKQAMTAHVHFGLLRNNGVLDCRQRSILFPLMHASPSLEHRRGHGKRGIGHAQWLENTLSHNVTQTFASNGLHHQAGPIHTGAVFPLFAGLKQQGCFQCCQRPADDAGLSLFLNQSVVVFVEKLITKACRVKQKHSGCNVIFGSAKPWGAVAIKPFEHLQFADHRYIGPGRRIEVESTFFDQLQHCCGGYRFRRGIHGENTVGRHCTCLTGHSLSRCTLVEQTVAPGYCCDYAWDALLSSRDGIEQVVE